MHNKIMDVQKSFERAYTDYARTGNVAKYNSDLDTLFEKYRNDAIMLNFCKSLLVAWAPVINELKGGCHEKKSRIKIISRQGGGCENV
ncbi:MAG: hypothetical protein H2212_07175 [Ruminococcus sp.]|nr:hypothetical protein [Ruminococcus sp.]